MRLYRKIIRIRGEDSPNVRYAMAQIAAGIEPTGEILVPGVLSWDDYKKRRATWDEQRQTVGLDAMFYVGAQLLLFPPTWLIRAASAEIVQRCLKAPAEAIGIDPAEGGDKTSMSAINRWGLKEQVSRKTPNTDDIPREVLAFMHAHRVPPEKVCFDRGGGGKQHADRLRAKGYPVRTVAFGESILFDLKRGKRQFTEKLQNREERYEYLNRRAEMYGDTSILCDPCEMGFAIPIQYTELRRQLSLMPKKYDAEGRLRMLPKNAKDPTSKEETLIKLLGCSPDEADSLVIAVHAMTHKPSQTRAGVG